MKESTKRVSYLANAYMLTCVNARQTAWKRFFDESAEVQEKAAKDIFNSAMRDLRELHNECETVTAHNKVDEAINTALLCEEEYQAKKAKRRDHNKPLLKWSYGESVVFPEGFDLTLEFDGYEESGVPRYALSYQDAQWLAIHTSEACFDGYDLMKAAAEAERAAKRIYFKRPINWSKEDWYDFRECTELFVSAIMEAENED